MTSFICNTTILVFELMAAPPVIPFYNILPGKGKYACVFAHLHLTIHGLAFKMGYVIMKRNRNAKETFHERIENERETGEQMMRYKLLVLDIDGNRDKF